MQDTGFARLTPRRAHAAGEGKKAPTAADRAQSDVHHVDSVRYNLAHAIPHLQEAQRHASKLTDRLRTNPNTAPHVAALDAARAPAIGA